jgi:ABC-2 type transport system ATP-binding protein
VDFGGNPDAFRAKLGNLSCIRSIAITGQKAAVELEHWECLSAVVSALVGSEVHRIALKERTLEEVFISLTGKGVRE